MTKSNEHECLVDDVRSVIWRLIEDYTGATWELPGITIERKIAACFQPAFKGDLLEADGYIWPPKAENSACIVLEVGSMRDGKWNGYIDLDDKPMRVLRIGKDKTAWILHARGTDFEAKMLQYWKETTG